MEWFNLFLCVIITSQFGLYVLMKWCFNYWRRYGVTYIEPQLLWGNSKEFFKGELSLGDQVTKFYKEFKSKGQIGGGVYFSITPVYIPVSLELIRNILQNDFSHFVNHGVYSNEEDDPLSGHLFSLEDERWKKVRAKLTPTFSSGKLKMMFGTIAACSEDLINVLRDHTLIQDPVDIRDVLSRFTIDVVGRCAFGIECNTLTNPQSEFREHGQKFFDPKGVDKIRSTIGFALPSRLLKAFHARQTSPEVEKFFMGVMKETVLYREENNIHRNDFMHLLLQLKNRGELSDDESLQIKANGSISNSAERLTFNELAAQCFGFFIAGFETTASTMTFALLELAINQDIQEKLREEILTVLGNFDGKICYEAMKEMKYLNMVIYETLRKHPPVPIIPRKCNKAYNIPGTDIVLEAGITINIPAQGIHRDPEYYPDPEKFDPERFNEENKSQRPAFSFLAFGEGPRNCIGFRFGVLEAKVGISTILKNFKVTLNNKTKTPIKYLTSRIVTYIDGNVWLNVTQIE